MPWHWLVSAQVRDRAFDGAAVVEHRLDAAHVERQVERRDLGDRGEQEREQALVVEIVDADQKLVARMRRLRAARVVARTQQHLGADRAREADEAGEVGQLHLGRVGRDERERAGPRLTVTRRARASGGDALVVARVEVHVAAQDRQDLVAEHGEVELGRVGAAEIVGVTAGGHGVGDPVGQRVGRLLVDRCRTAVRLRRLGIEERGPRIRVQADARLDRVVRGPHLVAVARRAGRQREAALSVGRLMTAGGAAPGRVEPRLDGVLEAREVEEVAHVGRAAAAGNAGRAGLLDEGHDRVHLRLAVLAGGVVERVAHVAGQLAALEREDHAAGRRRGEVNLVAELLERLHPRAVVDAGAREHDEAAASARGRLCLTVAAAGRAVCRQDRRDVVLEGLEVVRIAGRALVLGVVAVERAFSGHPDRYVAPASGRCDQPGHQRRQRRQRDSIPAHHPLVPRHSLLARSRPATAIPSRPCQPAHRPWRAAHMFLVPVLASWRRRSEPRDRRTSSTGAAPPSTDYHYLRQCRMTTP